MYGLAGVCDLAWAVLSGRVRAVALADRQSLSTAALLAGVKIDPPHPEQIVEDFAAELAASPKAPAAGRELRDLLGVT
ncbi:MAG: hypothetical protein LC798_10845 [Chloroflexi bacterium]|nr:hypothetical protein [Chloroflexota bacterium]